MAFLLGLVVGVAFGLVVIGFLAVGAYERGYDAASAGRRLKAI
jgi:hypothetical protein